MKVYLLNGYTNYDGFEIFGVFDTEELAEFEKNRLLDIDITLGYGPDYYLIEEFEVKVAI